MSDSTSGFRRFIQDTLRSRHFVLVCFISAFILRMCWISLVNPEPVSDFGVYYKTAIALSEGKGFILFTGAPTASWPVGYPGFLSLLFLVFGPSVFAGKVANVILYMGVLFLSYHLARRLFDSELTGRMTLAILSFYPGQIAYCSLLGTEIPSTFLLLLGVSLLVLGGSSVYRGLLSGAVFGLGCLVRPELLLVPAVLFVQGLVRRIRERTFWRYSALFLITYTSLALTILPWEVRNYHIFGTLTFVTTRGGMSMFIAHNPYANGVSGNKEMMKMLEGAGDEIQTSARARALAFDYIRTHPLRTIKQLPRKFYYLYYKDSSGVLWNERGIRSLRPSEKVFFRVFSMLSQAYYMAMMIAFFFAFLSLIGSKRYKSRFPRSSVIGLWVIAYLTGVALVFLANERYHFRTMPWIAMYVAALIVLVFTRADEQTV